MIKYPNGSKYIPSSKVKKSKVQISVSSANRGMNLEEDINLSNEFYLQNKICIINKRPTPINVVKVDYTNGPRIVDAYFEKQSTTDYNGIYKEKYVDFEAKSTKNITSFPLANISYHQIEHLKNVIYFGGIAFFIIEFVKRNEVYLLDAAFVIEFYEKQERKSIPYEDVKTNGVLIKKGFLPRLYYVDAINEKFFKKQSNS